MMVEDKFVDEGIARAASLDPATAFKPDKANVDVKVNHSQLIKFGHFNEKKEPKTVVAQFFDVTFTDPDFGVLRVVFAREVVADEAQIAAATGVEKKTHNKKHAWDIKVDFEKDEFTLITNKFTLDKEKPE